MKIRSSINILLGSLFISIFFLSNGLAEEVQWLNNYKFVGGQNVKVSHGSPDYPGSIVVDIISKAEPPEVEPVEPLDVFDEAVVAEIIKRVKVKKNTALTSVTVCFRDFEFTLPFGISIYGLGLPTDAMTVEDDVLYGSSELIVPEEECTVIPLEEGIIPEGEKLLLGIKFDIEEWADTTAAIVSAVGLGLTPTLLEIDGCDTGVPDIDVDGVPLSELINECAANAKNHGKFVSCVNKVVNPLKKAGVISGSEKGQITKCAAKSDLP